MWEMLVTQMITWAWIECYAPWQDDCIKTVQAEAYWFYLCYSRRSSKLYFQPILIFKCAMNFLFKDEKHHAIPVKYSIFSFLTLVSVFLRGYHYCRQIYKATSKQRMHEQHLGTPHRQKATDASTKSSVPSKMLNIPVTTVRTGTTIVSLNL